MSNINPYNIDGTFPVAGQDNSSQGFRTNFTNIKNNFLFAKTEIADLQDKVLVTQALDGQSVNNDMAGTKITRPQLAAWTQSLFDNGNISTSVILDFGVANFQKITTSGSLSISFTNWPTTTGVGAVGYGTMRVWIVVTSVSHTVQLPASVNIGDDNLAGYSGSGLLTFDAPGNYVFDISSVDGGNNFLIFDLTRNRSSIRDNATISGNATIDGHTTIGAGANITGNATITGIATIGSDTSIGGNTTIAGQASIGADATITGSTSIGGDASIDGNATVGGIATITGSASIGGTASIGGNTTINGGLTTNGGFVNQGTYFYSLALTGASPVIANTAMNTIIIDGVTSGTITTASIALPNSPVNGQTLRISTAAPITAANVYGPGGEQVKWVPVGTFSSGNTAISLTYISSSSTWYLS